MLSLVLVDIDVAVSIFFLAFVRALHRQGRLNRIIFDEAYLLVTAAHYRKNLGLLGVLRRVDYPFVYLIATLSPAAELELKQLLYFTVLEVLRASSDRPNLQYYV